MDQNIHAFLELFNYTKIEPVNYWACYEDNITKKRFVIRSSFQGAVDGLMDLLSRPDCSLNFNEDDVKQMLL